MVKSSNSYKLIEQLKGHSSQLIMPYAMINIADWNDEVSKSITLFNLFWDSGDKSVKTKVKIPMWYPLGLDDVLEVEWDGICLNPLVTAIVNRIKKHFQENKSITEGGCLYHDLCQLVIEGIVYYPEDKIIDVRIGS